MTTNQDDLLRSMVREVLRDVLPGIVEEKTVRRLGGSGTPTAPAPTPPPASAPAPASRTASDSDRELVVLRTDADLDAFVQRLLRLAENPATRHHLRSGRRRFGVASGGVVSSAVVAPSPPRGGIHRLERGALTERHVRQAAAAGEQIVIARSVVITPLARDRARALGVEITKEP